MRSAHTVDQVRAAEAELMARLPEGALMQRAAYGLAYAVLDVLGSAYGRRVVLLVGSGDNGGDALYAGAVLARRGCGVEAWLLTDRAHEGGLAALRRAGGRVVCLSTRPDASPGTRPEVGGRQAHDPRWADREAHDPRWADREAADREAAGSTWPSTGSSGSAAARG